MMSTTVTSRPPAVSATSFKWHKLGVDFAEPVGVGSRSGIGAVMAIAAQKTVKSGI